MMEELKLCPFCGGEARVNHYAKPSHWGTYYESVECNNCGSGTMPWPNEEKAVSVWNERITELNDLP